MQDMCIVHCSNAGNGLLIAKESRKSTEYGIYVGNDADNEELEWCETNRNLGSPGMR